MADSLTVREPVKNKQMTNIKKNIKITKAIKISIKQYLIVNSIPRIPAILI
jgi:hypothetical protein